MESDEAISRVRHPEELAERLERGRVVFPASQAEQAETARQLGLSPTVVGGLRRLQSCVGVHGLVRMLRDGKVSLE
ncbi:MAG TPA: hypothetical protein VMC43_03745 [Candidatus Paceibacterota bacterium]|nr:hypothetical protein [Candidatus Paceibacterota bacterium]